MFNTPKVISSDSEVCVAENDSVSLHCTFNAATTDGTTVVVWLKDNSNISGYENDTGPVQGKNNELISILYIRNFTHEDQGAYTCYCYYNKSVVTSHEVVTSDEATVAVYAKTNCPVKKDKSKCVSIIHIIATYHILSGDSKVLIASLSGGVGIVGIILVVVVILVIIRNWTKIKRCKNKS